jgi:K+-transporting ATPase A subunit
MLIGRFVPIVPVLALAGSLAAQAEGAPPTAGTMPTTRRCSACCSSASS